MKTIFVMFHLSICFIHAFSLSESQYNAMPRVIHIEPYEECLQDPDSLYCYVKFTLVADTPNPLMDMIHNYSTHTQHHYDHSKLRYGICVSKSCEDFTTSANVGLEQSLEACLNKTFWTTHKLKTKIYENAYCNIHQKRFLDRNLADTIVAAVCVVILLANIVGTLCDNFYPGFENGKGGHMLLSFSITRNWRKLVTVDSDSEPRIKRLQSIYGFRVLSTLMVLITHSAIPHIFLAENKQYIEEMYGSLLFRVLQAKPLSMQIFLLISGFLMVYLGLLRAEKEPISWRTALRMIRMRLLSYFLKHHGTDIKMLVVMANYSLGVVVCHAKNIRMFISLMQAVAVFAYGRLPYQRYTYALVPTYALILGLTATWLRNENAAPYTQVLQDEGKHCRGYWWAHILFINNHFNHSSCMRHSWYIATDTQLYCLGAVLFVVCRTARFRRPLLSLIAATAILLVAAQTYFLDLDAVAMASPETFLNVLMHHPTFQVMYMQPYSYIPGYMVSFCLAYYMYHWQKTDVHEESLRKYRPALMAVVVGILALSYSSSMFYDRPRDPAYVRVLYASLAKPVYAALLAAFMAGTFSRIFRVTSVFLEWRWWKSLSQLSLSVYLIHMPYISVNILSLHSPIHVTIWTMVWGAVKTIVISYLMAVVLWLLVEAPAGNLVDEFTKKTPVLKAGAEITPISENNEHDKRKLE